MILVKLLALKKIMQMPILIEDAVMMAQANQIMQFQTILKHQKQIIVMVNKMEKIKINMN